MCRHPKTRRQPPETAPQRRHISSKTINATGCSRRRHTPHTPVSAPHNPPPGAHNRPPATLNHAAWPPGFSPGPRPPEDGTPRGSCHFPARNSPRNWTPGAVPFPATHNRPQNRRTATNTPSPTPTPTSGVFGPQRASETVLKGFTGSRPGKQEAGTREAPATTTSSNNVVRSGHG